MAAPLGGDARDLGVPTINDKKCQRRAPWEAMMEIQVRPPSTLRNIDGGPVGGDAEDLGVHTIIIRNVNDRPLRR
jgi:hypothetical protein